MIGRVLGERYEIVEKIDIGGMAYVYKGVCRKTSETIAIKILKEEFSNNSDYVRRFKKEAETAFSLNHINIVRVKDIGLDNGIYYMVMEYIDGDTLKAHIEKKKWLGEKEAVGYTLQICSALAVAHRKGIIHRDIKPRNVLMDKGGRVKITDFGIAKSVSAPDEDDNQVIGSVHYVSPEQAKGERVDTRTDIYSLGIMLYEMLTGTLPYTGEKTIAVALKHINEPLTPPINVNSNLSVAINNIIIKATSKNKRDRYKSVTALKSDLVRALIDPSGSFVDLPQRQNTIRTKSPRSEKKNKLWKICILVVMTVALTVAVIFGADTLSATAQKTITSPDAVGLSSTNAYNLLEQSGLKIDIEYAPSETVADGLVISQAPVSGVQISEGSTIVLIISDGPADPIMPDVSGMSLIEAEAIILSMELIMDDVTYEPTEEFDTDLVLAQSPEAGDVISSGDVVTLVVSSEPEQENAVIPQVLDMTLEQAISLLSDAGFTNCYVYPEDSDFPEGTVVFQMPEQGLQAPLDSDIDLTISDYQNKEYVGHFEASIEITEIESKVKIVLEDTINGHTVYYIVLESNEDAGIWDLGFDIDCMKAGIKNVRVYINNIETYVFEVVFFERNEIEQR